MLLIYAILDADRCVAVNPSDRAPALIALEARMVIRTPRGERVVNAEDYFIGPGTDMTRMTIRWVPLKKANQRVSSYGMQIRLKRSIIFDEFRPSWSMDRLLEGKALDRLPAHVESNNQIAH